MNVPNREYQLIHHVHEPLPHAPARPSMPPHISTDSWVNKRRRAEQDCSNDPYARLRAKAARPGLDGAPRPGCENQAADEKKKVFHSGGEDYAAAAVLVELQKEEVDAGADQAVGDGYAVSAVPGPGDGGDGESRKRLRAGWLQ
ncbi:hypothetical protein CDD83_10491 [Cordyceps sp. RAO-2017]|nr:hypothetical protein CDD83_10491 [Cordyceps sp. RAO-2017]